MFYVGIFIVKLAKFIYMHAGQFIDNLTNTRFPFPSLSFPFPFSLPPNSLTLFCVYIILCYIMLSYIILYYINFPSGILESAGFFIPIEQVAIKVTHVIFKLYLVNWELAPFCSPKPCCKGRGGTFWCSVSLFLW